MLELISEFQNDENIECIDDDIPHHKLKITYWRKNHLLFVLLEVFHYNSLCNGLKPMNIII